MTNYFVGEWSESFENPLNKSLRVCYIATGHTLHKRRATPLPALTD